MAWEQEDGFDLDLGFEETGERSGDPWRGPFLDQSSWERFKDEGCECESRANETRVEPSAAQ